MSKTGPGCVLGQDGENSKTHCFLPASWEGTRRPSHSLSEEEPAVMTLGDGYGTAILLERVLLRVRGYLLSF